MTADDRDIAAPSRTLLALEGRGLLEIPALLAAAPVLALAPRGPPNSVMVLPGLGADDRSTVAIRRFLRGLGHDVHGWGRGRNIRRADTELPAIVDRLAALNRSDRRPVSLVGWSRGGIMAREIARAAPQLVRLVITLGSPFAAPSATNVGAIFEILTGEAYPQGGSPRLSALARPIPVPATSIYTRQDGVVAWRACLEEEGSGRENIEVRTTHLGLGFHPPALWIIADRLAQPSGTWRPFEAPSLLAPFFPTRRRS